MVQIRETMQKQLTNHDVDMQLLRMGLSSSTLRMFAGTINVLWIKEATP